MPQPCKITLNELSTSVAEKLNKIGDISQIESDLVTVIKNAQTKADQAFQSASDGKTMIATAITGKGVQASGTDTYPVLASKIISIPQEGGGGGINPADATAVAGDILAGKTAYTGLGKITGAIPVKTDTTPIIIGYLEPSGPDVAKVQVMLPLGAYLTESYPVELPGYTCINENEAGLVPENVLEGVTIFGLEGTHVCPTGLDTSDATAVAGDLRAGKTAYVNGVKVTGTLAEQSYSTLSPNKNPIVMPAGLYTNSFTVEGDFNLITANIISGKTIFNVAGSAVVATGTAVAADVLSSKTFSKAGQAGITGTMSNQGAVTITPSTVEQIIPAGYHNGLGKVLATTSTIRRETGTVTAANSFVSVSGLPFKPKRIFVWLTGNPETSCYYDEAIDSTKFLQLTYAGARWYSLSGLSSAVNISDFNLKVGAYPTGAFSWWVEG